MVTNRLAAPQAAFGRLIVNKAAKSGTAVAVTVLFAPPFRNWCWLMSSSPYDAPSSDLEGLVPAREHSLW
jgi:hypothetical protein